MGGFKCHISEGHDFCELDVFRKHTPQEVSDDISLFVNCDGVTEDNN